MKLKNIHIRLIENYLGLLSNINSESKTMLIKKLSATLRTSKQIDNGSLASLYGTFVSRKSADELIADIKKTRNFKRTSEEF